MGIISIEQADRILWLGRYTERVYTTVSMYNQYFDSMIDGTNEISEFCDKLDIPNIYTDVEDFMIRYLYDTDNPDSIISNLYRAFDNAIVLRETIGSESLSYIQLAIYDWKEASKNPAPPLLETQKLIDHIMAFWGVTDDLIDSEEVRNILKAGKRIERADLYARLEMPRKAILREILRLRPRVERSGLPYDPAKLEKLSCLANADEIDYYQIVQEVESIF